MTNVNVMFAIIVLGSIAFIIAGAMLPDAMTTYYDGIASLDQNANVSDVVVTLFELAPLGLALAMLLILLAVAGLKLGGKI